MWKKSDNSNTQPVVISSAILYTAAICVGQGVVLISTKPFTELMTAESWGIVQTYLSIVLIINTVVGLNLHISLRNSFTDMPLRVNEFASSTLFLSTISFLFFALIANVIVFAIGVTEYLFVIEMALLQSYAVFVLNFYLSKLAMEFKYKLRALLLWLPNVLHVALSLLLLYFLPDVSGHESKIFGNMMGIAIFAILGYCSICGRGRVFVNRTDWWYGLAISLPSIAYSLSDLILMQCDRIMITYYIGPAETGIYSNAYNIGVILWMISTATGGAWLPWFFHKMSQNKRSEIQKFARGYIVLFSFMAIVLLMISPEILKLLTPNEYWGGIKYLSPIIVSSYIMFLYSFPVNVEFYLKKTRTIAINTVIASLVNIMLNVISIPIYGSFAAAFSTVISYGLLFFLQWRSYKKFESGLFEARFFGYAGIVVGAFACIQYFVLDYVLIRYLICTLLIIGLFLFIYKNRKVIKNVLQDKG